MLTAAAAYSAQLPGALHRSSRAQRAGAAWAWAGRSRKRSPPEGGEDLGPEGGMGESARRGNPRGQEP